MNYLDLFAGAGGLSEGFASIGADGIAHIESDKSAAQTLETRVAYYYLKSKERLDIYRNYQKTYHLTNKVRNFKRNEFLSEIPDEVIKSVINLEISYENLPVLFEKIDKQLKLKQNNKLDIIIGGPPCQAYSVIGRARSGKNNKDDERHYLYKLYVEFLKRYTPKVFVFENVPGIYTAKNGTIFEDVEDKLKGAGYRIRCYDFNSFDFGVPQRRERVIIMGWRNDLQPKNFEYPNNKINKYNVIEFLKDLPKIKAGETWTAFEYRNKPSEALLGTGIRNNHDLLTHHIARFNNERDLEIYRRAVKLWDDKGERLLYSNLPERLITHNNVTSFLDRYKVVAGNIDYSQTIVAHISKDGHYFIHPSLEQNRSISVREAARLQSFPDNYFFEGSRTSNFVQIGNAVPPLMAKHIAKWIKKNLE